MKFILFRQSLVICMLLSLASVSLADSTPKDEGRNTWSIDVAVGKVEVTNICPNIPPLKLELSQDQASCTSPITCPGGTPSEDGKNCIQPSSIKKVCAEGASLFAGVCGSCPPGLTAREAFRKFACTTPGRPPVFPTNTTAPTDDTVCPTDWKLSEDKKTCSLALACPPNTNTSADGKICSVASKVNKTCPAGAQVKGEECLSCKGGWTFRFNPDRSVRDCTTSGATCAASQGRINPKYADICDVRLPIEWLPKPVLRPGMPISYVASDKISDTPSNICISKMTDGKSYPGTLWRGACYVPFAGTEVKKEFPSADTFVAALPNAIRNTWVEAKNGVLPAKPGVVINAATPDLYICRATPEGEKSRHIGFLAENKCTISFAGKAQVIEKFELLSGI